MDGRTFYIEIPDYDDDGGKENVTVTVSNMTETFMVFEEINSRITLNKVKNQDAGNYSLEVTYTDQEQLSSKYQLNFEIRPYEVETQEV